MDALLVWPPTFVTFVALALLVLALEVFVGEFIFMGLAGALVAAGAIAWMAPEFMASTSTMLLVIAVAWLCFALALRSAFAGKGGRKDADGDPNEY
ncbi:MAG: hypothetical protein AAF763_18475 [Pseudomonadota bacterium]